MAKNSPELVLRNHIQQFVRAFGLLRNQTPCGKPISISEAHALMFLKTWDNDNLCSQADLLKSLALDKSNVARLCMSLEDDGFIVQAQSQKDRRVRQLSLTKKGERLADSLLAASQERFGKILDHIPMSHHSQIFRSLDLLTQGIHAANLRK
jgi:DNA-binding MarR family transcriptional regulator